MTASSHIISIRSPVNVASSSAAAGFQQGACTGNVTDATAIRGCAIQGGGFHFTNSRDMHLTHFFPSCHLGINTHTHSSVRLPGVSHSSGEREEALPSRGRQESLQQACAPCGTQTCAALLRLCLKKAKIAGASARSADLSLCSDPCDNQLCTTCCLHVWLSFPRRCGEMQKAFSPELQLQPGA